MTKRFSILSATILAGLLVTGCEGEDGTTGTTTVTATGMESSTGTAADAAGPATLSDGFATPESVLYDPADDVYYVSNINGRPLEADGNGYISRISAASHEMEQKWIDGTRDGVELDAPKGMALVGNELWVTDIDRIRRFNKATGQLTGSIPIEGATFLNDLATGADGAAYVSDSGMRAGTSGFEPAGTDAVYRISSGGEVESIASGSELGGPNGLHVSDGEIWGVTFGSNELYRLVDGKKMDVITVPAGGLDGIATAADGDFLISSWEGSAVYKGPAAGPFSPVVEQITSPADIGVDSRRNLLLIPVFQEDRVEIRPLDSGGGTASGETDR
ncbi:MAG: hypothetical protein KY432_02230 [Acidobacteria bacterium]|nr:hypothetical protein [Acidobacteriota bacterium]